MLGGGRTWGAGGTGRATAGRSACRRVGWELRASPASHGRHASRCLLTPQTSLPWRLALPPNPKHLRVAGSPPREMKQGGRGPSRLALLMPKARSPGGRSRGGGGGGHGLPRCSKWRPPRSQGLGRASRWCSPGMAGKWDLQGPWALSARRSVAWRVDSRVERRPGGGSSCPRLCPSQA